MNPASFERVRGFSPACSGANSCQGIALEDVGEDWIDHDDPAFPLIVTVRAQRAN